MKKKKLLNTRKNVTRGLAAVAVFALLFQCIGAFPVVTKADESETMTLSGTITENIEILPGTNKVILKNLIMEEPAELILAAPVEVEIAEGTENHVYIIEAMYDTKFSGSGTLNVTAGIIESDCRLMFSHLGTINVSGPVTGISGSIVLNSGILNVVPESDLTTGLSVYEGSIVINGGELNVASIGTAISSYGTVTVNGGSVNASSENSLAVIAGTGNGSGLEISANVTEGNGLTVQTYDTDTGTYAVLGSADTPDPATEIAMSGPADENSIASYDEEHAKNVEAAKKKAAEDKAAQESLDKEQQEREEAAKKAATETTDPSDNEIIVPETQKQQTSGSHSNTPLIIVIAVVAVGAAAATVSAVLQNKKNKKKKK